VSDLPTWSRRSREEAALLNPAFVALVVHQAAQTFEEESGEGLPFPLAFLVPPVVVAEGIRSQLPDRKDSSLAAWVQGHPEIRLRFAEHAAAMIPVVREGVLFAVTARVMSLSEARLRATALPRGSALAIAANTDEFQEVIRKAKFVGRWYANAGTTETIMAFWGVRP
jgi:hypothetical protein